MSQRKGAKIRDKAEKKAAKIATKGCGVVSVLLQVPLRRLNVTLCVYQTSKHGAGIYDPNRNHFTSIENV